MKERGEREGRDAEGRGRGVGNYDKKGRWREERKRRVDRKVGGMWRNEGEKVTRGHERGRKKKVRRG